MKVTEQAEKPAVADSENIDKIRDILFGVQVKDFENRFKQLENRFEKELSKERTETLKNFERIEELIAKEIGSLSEKIYNEEDSRNDAVKGLTVDLQDASKKLSAEIEKLIAATNKKEAALQKDIEKQNLELSVLVESKHKESLNSLQESANDLRDTKVDRSALAKAFSDFADLLRAEDSDE
ncbi:MAG: hypothetical protein ACK5NT_07100 [Pyrinomonadaceae bacterium]